MFNNPNLYPISPMLIKHMAAKVQGNPRKILDPSAGKGDLIEQLKKNRYAGCYVYNMPDISAIEIDPLLQATLRGKGIKLLDSDFLNYSSCEHFDLIIGNPPFDRGEMHLLKAISILFSGQILFLLNAETLRNPYSNHRKELVRKLADLGAEIEYIPDGFLDAERTTPVEVALINIVVKRTVEADLFAGCSDEYVEEEVKLQQKNEVSVGKSVREMVAEYNETLRIGTETIMGFYRNYSKIRGYLSLNGIDEKNDVKLSGDTLTALVQNQMNNLLRQLRISFWRRTTDLKEVDRRLTEKKRKEFELALVQQSFMDFNESNVRQFVLNIIGSYENTLTEAVIELFDNITSHCYRGDNHPNEENIHYFSGWCTNSAYKVSQKVILPGRDWRRSFWNDFSNRWEIGCDTARMLNDIDKVCCFFSGAADYTSITSALEKSFSSTSRWCRQSKIESTYFICTVHKQGTIHLKFRDPDILRRINVVACRGRNWLPENYGKKAYKDMSPEEKSVVEAFEGVSSYNRNLNAVLFKSTATTQIEFKEAA